MSGVTYTAQGRVGSIVFSRPKANSYDLAFQQDFGHAILQANQDPDVRVVLLRSGLDRFFSAGADIAAFANNSTEANQRLVDLARQNLKSIEDSDRLYIAAIRGHALGGGLEIALACDLRVGGEGSYQVGLPESKLGLIPGNGGSQRLARLVGMSRALDLCLTGRSIQPREAFEMGLLNRLFPPDAFDTETLAFAQSLAEGAPLALAALKKGIRAGMDGSLADGLALEATLVDTLYDSADAREGFQAFTERRPPRFEGR